ncbi:MAG: hypothetical protein K0R66_1468 [Gammaproteobacteria bacterium]|nr:hypothetical protein [Gammaproteobacteria bacterium]
MFSILSLPFAAYLLSELRSSNAQNQINAAKVIMNFALNHDNQNVIREVGAIPDLVALLEKDEPGLLENLAMALYSLSYHNVDNQNAIIAAGGIPRLVNLLEKDRPELQKNLIKTLNNLASDNPGRQNAIREAGAIPILESLSHSANHSLRTEASNLLSKLSEAMALSLSDASSTKPSYSAKPM